MNKDTLIGILAAIVGAFIILTIIGFTTEDDDVTVNDTNDVMSMEEAEAEFMLGCSPEGNNDEYCNCAWGELEADYTVGEIVDIFMGDYPEADQIIGQTIRQCI